MTFIKTAVAAMALAAIAQQAQSAVTTVRVECMPREAFTETIRDHVRVESLIGAGLSANGTSLVALWAGPQGEFVITGSVPGDPDTLCILATGTDWRALDKPLERGSKS